MGMASHAFWFGEDQARYVIAAKPNEAEAIVARCKAADIPVRRIGSTAGDALTLPGERPILVTALSERFEGFLPAYMAGAH
jgi:phosphoribosylformylglycinamidine (FGAM) synthase-like enzyme